MMTSIQLLVVTALCVSLCRAAYSTGQLQKIMRGKKFTGFSTTHTFKAPNDRYCSVGCLSLKSSSFGFNYHIMTMTCLCLMPSMNTLLPPQTDAGFVCARKTGWQLLLRVHSGSQTDVYQTWTSPGGINMDNDGVTPQQKETFKSTLVDTSWTEFTKIKIALYTDGQEKMKLIFKRTGTDLETFFQPMNLIDGNYPTIHQTHSSNFRFFSILGSTRIDSNFIYKRRFDITKRYATMCVDYGFLMVLDNGTQKGCPYDGQDRYPAFLYSSLSTAQSFSEMPTADTFVIMGSLED